MRRSLAAFLFAVSAMAGGMPAVAQTGQPGQSNLIDIIEAELPPDREELALKLVQVSGTARTFDEVLPTIAMQAKNAFIRANPQMQLGIIDVVDRIAVSLVSRRPELDRYLARVWASAFTDAEMEELIAFYESETGKKFSSMLPQLLGVQTAAAEEWGKSVNQELTLKVQAELRSAVAAEQEALQGDVAGPAEEEPAPPQ